MCYIGPMAAVGLHTHATEAWLFGLDGAFQIGTASGEGHCRTAVVPGGLEHLLQVGGGRLVVLYLDPVTDQSSFCTGESGLLVPHPAEAGFLDLFARLMVGQAPEAELWQMLDAALAERRVIDTRLQAVIGLIEQRVDQNLGLAELAESVNLSPSRLLHLSREQLGVPLRRYRLFERMRRSVVDIHGGKPLTDTALDLGFATPSHFSTSFRGMFGVTPSSVLLGRPARGLE